jgi:DNA polymerase alpha subunit B
LFARIVIMAAVTESAIAQELPDASRNPELLSRCMRICGDCGLSPAELRDEWDLLTMNRPGLKRMSIETLAELESQTRATQQAKRAKFADKSSRQQFPSRSNATTFSKDTAHLLGNILSGSTPAPRRSGAASLSPYSTSTMATTPMTSSASPNGAFTARADAGKLMCSLNPDAGIEPSEEQLEFEVHDGASAHALGESLMWERMEDRARALDGQLAVFERALDGVEGLPPLVSVVSTGAEEVTVVGRICCEGEGKLNVQSIFLEGSRVLSNACRVRLDLSGCEEYALFPGQVVAVLGVNSVGHTFVARRILPAPPSAVAAAPAAAQRPVTVVAAAGPFTTSDDLTYAPLTALLTKAAEVRPDALVLIGPFVDEQHPSLAVGDLPVSFDELFERQVLARLSEFVETQLETESAKVTHVVLLPSTRDIHHQSAYPQPALRMPAGVPEHVLPYLHLCNNPTCVAIGGVRLAAGSVDTLMLLGQQELARVPPPAAGAPKPDRMARLASHVLQQRQMLPLFPAPSDERSPLPVDVVANLKAGCLSTLPDVLFVPSDLAPFAKIGYAGVLAINPGRLTRRQAGGNYATLCVRPPAPPALDEADGPRDAVASAAEGGTATNEGVPMEAEASPPTSLSAAAESVAAPDAADGQSATGASAGAAPANEGTPSPPIVAPFMALPMPADARHGLESRAFVEVKRI